MTFLRSRTLLRFAFILMFLPAIGTGLLIYACGVDVPYWDEWDGMANVINKQLAGTLQWSDLFAQHNEHRIFFPRLIMLGVADCTHWNIRAEMAVVWLLGCLCSFNFWQMSRATGWKNSILGLVLLIAANLFLFNLHAWEDWLWGFQVGFLLPLTCVTTTLWLSFSKNPWIAFSSVFVLCVISSFSIASGFISWLLVLPLLLFPEGKFQWRDRLAGWAIWFLGGAGSIYLYFHSYIKPPWHPSMWLMFTQPVEALNYVLVYLGSPFGYGTCLDSLTDAIAIGTVLLILFISVLVYLVIFWRDAALRARTLPWLVLSFYTMMCATLTMMGRMGFGIDQAQSTRYIPFASMLPVALLFLLAAIYLHGRERFAPTWTLLAGWGLAVLGLAAVCLSLSGSYVAIGQWQQIQKDRRLGKALVETLHLVDRPELITSVVFQSAEYVANMSDGLDKFGYLHPAMLKSNLVSIIAPHKDSPDGSYGFMDPVTQTTKGEITCRGWAVLPYGDRKADAVLLTYDDDQGQPTIFDLANTGTSRGDVAQALHNPDYIDSGFDILLKTNRMAAGQRIIRAWAFDSEEGRAYPLKGQATVTK